ncbi:MAG TPA: site-specific integrase, partial [Nitrososphaeraceae archaeon]
MNNLDIAYALKVNNINLFKVINARRISNKSLKNKNKITAQLTDAKDRFAESTALNKYIRNIRTMNKRTAHEYYLRLTSFQDFVISRSQAKTKFPTKLALDNIITQINKGSDDPYEILSDYVSYLQTNYNISTLTLKHRVITVKNFLEYYDIDISPRKFKLKVKLPKTVKKNKEALSKEDITDILNACSDIRLKTYVMLLAATGMRATEALSIRIKDLYLKSKPANVFVRGEYTKTRADRTVFLTDEVVHQLTSWMTYKYRTRRICYRDEQTKKTITEYRTPEKKESDLVFALYQNPQAPAPMNLYVEFVRSFGKTLDCMNKGDREDGSNGRRREITLHSFRRFVKTTISDLGYSDYSEWFIGHSGSTYWRKKESEKAELFRKIEPYLTFLNIHQLERQGADIQSKVQELEDLNSSLRERDKVKDDAIAHLSDQLLAISTRLQELERKES